MFSFLDMIIVRPIVNLLFVLYNFVGDFGMAIIILTIIVKLIMWPLVKKQLHQTKIMKKLTPELAEIKKNAKGNRMVEQLQTMDLYKRYNVKPFRTILILLLQLPIFFGIYSAINTITLEPTEDRSVANRAYSWVAELPRVKEVIDNHDNFKPALFGVIDLSAKPLQSNITISSVVALLFVIASAIMQYIISRQQMPTKKARKTMKQLIKEAEENGTQPDQTELNNIVSGQMVKFMPFMMLLIMINFMAALPFYYLISNIITYFQQRAVLNRDEYEMDNLADKQILKELKTAQEAEIITNKSKNTHTSNKTKSKKNITRISSSNNKKRR